MFKSHPSRCSHCVRKFNSLTVNMYSLCSQVKFPSVEMFSRFSQVQLSPRRYVLTAFASSIPAPSRCAHLGRKFNSHPVEMYPRCSQFRPRRDVLNTNTLPMTYMIRVSFSDTSHFTLTKI